MRTFSLIAAFTVTVTVAFTTIHCHAQWPGTTRGTQNTRSLEIGGRAYSRPGIDSNFPLITDAETGETLFTADQATNGGSSPGLEIKYGFEGPGHRQLEFRTILADFDTETNVPGPGLASPLFPGAGVANFNYGFDTDLLSFELTAGRDLVPGIRYSFGPRYVSFKETVTSTIDSVGVPGPIGVVPAVAATTVASREATNGLIGFQAGLDLKYPIAQQIYTTGFIKTGGYYNPTEVRSSQGTFVNGALFDSVPGQTSTFSTGSFLAEVGGRLYVDLCEDKISAYAGYEAMWIDGVALAPPAFLSPPGADVDTRNTVFFQAVTFGLRMNF